MALEFLRNFTLIADDVLNLHLEIEEAKSPSLEEKDFDFTPGGATGEMNVSLGITNKLEMGFKLATQNRDINKLFGLAPGIRTAFTMRKALFDDEDGRPIEATIDIKGRLMKIDPEAMKGGEKSGYDYMISSISWYQQVEDGKVIRQYNFKLGGWTVHDGNPTNVGVRSALAI